MSGAYPLLVTGHSEKWIHIWNLEHIFQNKFNPYHVDQSPLKYQTSSIACFADGKGFAVGSIEGRCGIVNVNLNNPDKITETDFCFKCHRSENAATNDGDAYTVNHIAFNKLYGTFATVGSDGTFIVWNKDTKSRYKSSKAAPMPMCAVAFNDEASMLAFASGEDWGLGFEAAKKRQNQIKIYIRKCEKDDVFKPKK